MSTSQFEMEKQLRYDVGFQSRISANTHPKSPAEWDAEELRDLEARIQDTARKLRPDAPEVAIESARRYVKLKDLRLYLAERADLPLETMRVAPRIRARQRWSELKIIVLARELEPTAPWRAIDAANTLTDALKLEPPKPAINRHLEAVLARRIKLFPPSAHDLIREVLGHFRRLDALNSEHLRVSRERKQLPLGGNILELEVALDSIPSHHAMIEASAPHIYRDPHPAIRALSLPTDDPASRRQATSSAIAGPAPPEFIGPYDRRRVWQDALRRFAETPDAFGRLRGIHVLGYDSPKRTWALKLAREVSFQASITYDKRYGLESYLGWARYYQRVQIGNHELLNASPSRVKLFAELGRQMERVSFDEIRPLPNTSKYLRHVKQAEIEFLQPLREATRSFRTLDGAPANALAQEIAKLYRSAPRHVLKRLSTPQMQAVLIATSIAKRMTKAVVKGATA